MRICGEINSKFTLPLSLLIECAIKKNILINFLNGDVKMSQPRTFRFFVFGFGSR